MNAVESMEKFSHQRYSNIKQLIQSCSKDEILSAMKEDEETNAFAMQRFSEMVESEMAAEREATIQALMDQNAELWAQVDSEIMKVEMLQEEVARVRK